MIKSPDPSRSHTLIRQYMSDNDIPQVVYHWEEDYINSPNIGPEELSELCYDVMVTDEHERPTGCYGFVITTDDIEWLV